MRWYRKSTFLKDRLDEIRVVYKFIWFPKWLETPDDGKEEWHWLEYMWVCQKVCRVDVGGSNEWGKYAYKWLDYKWGYG